MAENSSIEWTHHTFNLWYGCSKVSTGCKHCYAESFDRRHLLAPDSHWGPQAPRHFAGDKYMRAPLAWNRTAERTGQRKRVFCMSMGDVFELHAIPIYAAIQATYRQRLFALIEQTPWLDWLLLTKRPEHITPMLPSTWRRRPPCNVWLGASIENQAAAAERLPVLLDTSARVHFVSYEPALGPIDLEEAAPGYCVPLQLDWLIAGSESGLRARPAEPDWFRNIRDQCQRLGVNFFFKQWVEGQRRVSLPVLDGRQWCQVPSSCRPIARIEAA